MVKATKPCRKCGIGQPSEHHIWPDRWDWPEWQRDVTTTLCHCGCHTEIEQIIELFERKGSIWCVFCDKEQLPDSFYSMVLDWYLQPEVNSVLVGRLWQMRANKRSQRRATLPISVGVGFLDLCRRFASGRGCLEAKFVDGEVVVYWRRRWREVKPAEKRLHQHLRPQLVSA